MESCCHSKNKNKHERSHDHAKQSSFKAAFHATIHCLTGCVIGEAAGLMIGVHFGLSPWSIIILATTLAYLSGFALSVFPLMRRTGLNFKSALKAIWIGEVISIGVMEITMNTVDYHMGGMTSGSIMTSQFWIAMAFAIIAGFMAAFPINILLISKQLKKCH